MFKNSSSGIYMSLFIENMINLYEESGKVNYRTNDFVRKIYRTQYFSPCRNHSPEQKFNNKNISGTDCTALQGVLFGRFHESLTITFLEIFLSAESLFYVFSGTDVIYLWKLC